MNTGIPAPWPVHAVLFDLDGTLLDTAPDMAHALNLLLAEQHRTPLRYEDIRPRVSDGSAGLIAHAFGLTPEAPQFEDLRRRFLELYQAHLVRETCLFPGMAPVLARLEGGGIAWGVVTNKPAWLTDPLVRALGLWERAACVVSGDTTTNRKPHPEPLHHACRLAGQRAADCLYVGDARRDIEAGRGAGMKTLIALFGYVGADTAPESWGADGMVRRPEDLLNWIALDPVGANATPA